ncbi:unnamed protein product [Victoria cruziana]
MRSRFLNFDYIRRPPRDIGIDDPGFLSLPVPEPRTSDRLPEGKLCYKDLVLAVPSDLQSLCFKNALFCFVSGVVPRLYGEHPRAEECQSDQNDNDSFTEEQKDRKHEAVEVVSPGMEIKLEAFDSICGATSSYLNGLAEQINLVDRMNLKHDEKKQSFQFYEAAYYVRKENQIFLPKVSLFEACEIGPLLCSYSMVEAFHFLVADIRLHLLENCGLELARYDCQSAFNVCRLDSLPGCVLHLRVLDLEIQPSGVESETEVLSGNRLLLKTLNSFHVPSVHKFVLDEVQVLDICDMNLNMSYGISTVPIDNEISMPRLAELSSSGIFYEAIVTSELAQADNVIKSLPIPLLEDKDIISISEIVEVIFCDTKLCFSSASDQIYLDWHVSQENECSHLACCLRRKKLDIVISCEMPSRSESLNYGMLIKLVLSDSSFSKSVLHQLKEACETIPNQAYRKEGIGIHPNGETVADKNLDGVSLLMESVTLSSDAKFFISARKGIATKSHQEEEQNRTAEEKIPVVPSSLNFNKSCSSPGVTVNGKNFETHLVYLSDVILNIVKKIYGSYISTLGNEKELKDRCTAGDADALTFSKEKLMDLLTILTESALACEDAVMHLIVLYTLKQMAHYVCFSGIHTCCFYMRTLLQGFRNLGNRLACIKSLIEDAYHKAEKGVIEFHPALSVIDKILQTWTPQSSKILIVAERSFWLPLTRKLASLRISFHELRFKSSSSYQGVLGCINQVMLETDCLITSREHLCTFFPFNMFNTVLEYGGYYGSPSVINICQQTVRMHHVHFLKINLEDLDVSGVLYEGFNIFQHLELSMEESYQPSLQLVDPNNQELVNLLNFDPISKENYKFAKLAPDVKVGTGIMLQENPDALPPREPDFTDASSSLFPSIVVIANTKKFRHELLMSRRSSYQKILSMEKDGIQVVEREMHLPVDLVLSSATCLLWLDAKRVVASSPKIIPPSIPLCVESIATELIMLLSSCFSDCILIFEGETGFHSAVMESSDSLYAAAASLDMHLQLFFSGSSDFTDNIVVSCIRHALKLNKFPCPAMLESETLAESFLASFPSINPLSAHVLVSCEVTISDIFEWSCKQRLQAVQKYHVPEESIVLFSVLCRFGDVGESMSGVTECSSTVSSALSSDSSYRKMQSPRKKQKYSKCARLFDIQTNEHLHFVQERIYNSTYKASIKFPSHPDNVCFNNRDSFSIPSSEIAHPIPDLQLEPGASWTRQLKWHGLYHEDIKKEPMDSKLPILDQDFSFHENQFWAWKSEGIRKGTDGLMTNCDCPFLFGPSNLAGLASADSCIHSDIWTPFMDSKHSLNKEICGQNPKAKREGFCEKKEVLQETNAKRKSRNIQLQEGVTSPGYVDNSYLQSYGLQNGLPSTVEFLKRIKLKMKMRDKFIVANYSGKASSKKGSSKRKSLSSLDSYKYEGSSSKEKNMNNQKWRKPFKLAEYQSGSKN